MDNEKVLDFYGGSPLTDEEKKRVVLTADDISILFFAPEFKALEEKSRTDLPSVKDVMKSVFSLKHTSEDYAGWVDGRFTEYNNGKRPSYLLDYTYLFYLPALIASYKEEGSEEDEAADKGKDKEEGQKAADKNKKEYETKIPLKELFADFFTLIVKIKKQADGMNPKVKNVSHADACANLRKRIKCLVEDGSELRSIGCPDSGKQSDEDGKPETERKIVKHTSSYLKLKEETFGRSIRIKPEIIYKAMLAEKDFYREYFKKIISILFDSDSEKYHMGLNISGDCWLFNEMCKNVTEVLRSLGYYRFYYTGPIESLAEHLFTLFAYSAATQAGMPPETLLGDASGLPKPLVNRTLAAEEIVDYTDITENFPVNTIERFSNLQLVWNKNRNRYAGAELISLYRFGARLYDALGIRCFELKPNAEKAKMIAQELNTRSKSDIIKYQKYLLGLSDTDKITPDSYDSHLALLSSKYSVEKYKNSVRTNVNQCRSLRKALNDHINSPAYFDPNGYELLKELINDYDVQDRLADKVKHDPDSKWYFDDFGKENIEEGGEYAAVRLPGMIEVFTTIFNLRDGNVDVQKLCEALCLSSDEKLQLRNQAHKAWKIEEGHFDDGTYHEERSEFYRTLRNTLSK